jgi:DNA polymerase-3 subunit delta'
MSDTGVDAWAPWLDAPLARGLALRGHAVLVHAAGALGQFDLALALARAWLCESPAADGRACGGCPSCRLMDGLTHPDFRLLVPEALRPSLGLDTGEEGGVGDGDDTKRKRQPSRQILMDDLQAAIDWSHSTATRGGARVLMLHPAEAMNLHSANALLKTLEEPPGRLKLVLTADDPEALLPTVRSRCQRVAIAPPDAAAAASWLEGQGMRDAAVLLAAAGGLPHAARALQADGIDAAAWSAVPQAVRRGQPDALAAWPLPRVVEALHKLCHDLIAVRAGGTPRFFDAAALSPVLSPQPPPLAAQLAWQRTLLEAARHDEHPLNAPLAVDAWISRAAALWQTARPPAPGSGGALATLPRR